MREIFESLETLKSFDEAAFVSFTKALKLAVLDVQSRPNEKAARKVEMTISISPVIEQSGEPTDALVDFKIATKMPPQQTASQRVGMERGHLFFNPLSPDNPHQRTIDEPGGESDVRDVA